MECWAGDLTRAGDPAGEKRAQSAREEKAFAFAPCGHSLAGCGCKRRPAWRRVSAVRKCSFLFFPFPVVGLGQAFLVLDSWADLAQEESHQVVVIGFHYLKVGGKRGVCVCCVVLCFPFGIFSAFYKAVSVLVCPTLVLKSFPPNL